MYPFLAERPDLRLSLDVLEEDDRQLFQSVMAEDRASVVREARIQLQPRPYYPEPIEEDVSNLQRIGGRVVAKGDQHVAIEIGPSAFAIIERSTLDHDPELQEQVRIRLKN
jgi:hypothetical protein